MRPKYNFDTKINIPWEEEIQSMDGRFHEERDDKYEFRKFVRSMLEGLQDI